MADAVQKGSTIGEHNKEDIIDDSEHDSLAEGGDGKPAGVDENRAEMGEGNDEDGVGALNTAQDFEDDEK